MLGGDIWWAQLWNKILITRGNHFKDFLKNSDTLVQLGFPWLSTTPQSHSKQPWVHLQCWQHCFEIFAIRSHAIVNCPLEVNDTIFKSTTFTCIIPINHLQPGYKYKFQSLAQFFFLIQAKSWSSIVLFYSNINCYNSQSNETINPFQKHLAVFSWRLWYVVYLFGVCSYSRSSGYFWNSTFLFSLLITPRMQCL